MQDDSQKQTDTPEIEAWVKAQEGILELEMRIRALANFMKKNKTAAMNPARRADLESSSQRLQKLLEQVSEIEQGISGPQLAELKADLEEVRRLTRKAK